MMNAEGPLAVIQDEIVGPGAPWSARLGRGQVLRIVDLEGEQGVDFLCYDAADPRERYYAPNTIKKSGTLRLTEGHALYSDRGRPLFTIVGDSCGHHDTIAGCCSAPSNAMLYGVEGCAGVPRELPGRPGGTRPGMDGHRAQRKLFLRRAGIRRGPSGGTDPSSPARPSPAITSICEPTATSSPSSPTALRSTTRPRGAGPTRSAYKFSKPRLSPTSATRGSRGC